MRRLLTWLFRLEFRIRNRSYVKRYGWREDVRRAENFWVNTRMNSNPFVDDCFGGFKRKGEIVSPFVWHLLGGK